METTPEANGSGQAEPVLVVEANSATVCDCRNHITSLEAQVAQAEQARVALKLAIDAFKSQMLDFLTENHDSMDSDHVEEIAEIMGLDLEVEHEITVTCHATVTLKLGQTLDEDEVDARIFYGYTELDTSLERVDSSEV